MSESDTLPKTPRTRLRRLAKRGSFDRELINGILDEALIAHVGLVGEDGAPVVIPTACWRIDDHLYIHGAMASRLLKHGRSGHPLCITVTLLDALVLARSAFHHSMNYRSVVLFGHCELVEGEEKMSALMRFVDDVVPGRGAQVRPPNETEMKATMVLRVPIEEASAKVRTGPPVDDDEDYDLPVWAGLVPFAPQGGSPMDDGRLVEGVEVPEGLRGYGRG